MNNLDIRLTKLEQVAARDALRDVPIVLTPEEREEAISSLFAEYEVICERDGVPENPEPGSVAERAQRVLEIYELARARRDAAEGGQDADN